MSLDVPAGWSELPYLTYQSMHYLHVCKHRWKIVPLYQWSHWVNNKISFWPCLQKHDLSNLVEDRAEFHANEGNVQKILPYPTHFLHDSNPNLRVVGLTGIYNFFQLVIGIAWSIKDTPDLWQRFKIQPFRTRCWYGVVWYTAWNFCTSLTINPFNTPPHN